MFSLIIFEFQIVIQLKSKRLKMPCYGYIGVKKPLINIKGECLFGRAEECDIRIDLPTNSREHAKLKVQVSDGTVNIIALSKTNNVVSLAPMAAQSSCIRVIFSLLETDTSLGNIQKDPDSHRSRDQRLRLSPRVPL